jgi:hypothetical protein
MSVLASGLLGSAVTSSVTAAQIFGVATGLPLAVIAVRGFRSSTLLIDEDCVTVRTLLRRRRWSLDQILGGSIETGYVGMYERRFPVLHLVGGGAYECREINTSAAKSEELAPIVEAVNQAVRERAAPRAERPSAREVRRSGWQDRWPDDRNL